MARPSQTGSSDTAERPVREDAVGWEARNAKWAGALAIAAAALTVLGSVISAIANNGSPRAEDRVLTVVDTLQRAASGRPIPPGSLAIAAEYIGTHTTPFIAGAVLMGLGALLTFAPLAYLYRAARARSRVPRIGLIMAAIGAAGFGIGQSARLISIYMGAADFVAGSDHSNSAAADALSNSGQAAGQLVAQIGQLSLALGFALISLHAMRVGLLTRFLGFLGMIVGGTLILPLDQFGIIRSFWLIAVGLLILGRMPTGRPPAWARGEAVPWPTQQQIREEREAARQAKVRERGGRGRGGKHDGRSDDGATGATNVPRAPAPQPRRTDAQTGPHPASSRRKRKRRS